MKDIKLAIAAFVLLTSNVLAVSSQSKGEGQYGLYLGPVLSPKISDVHGDHINSAGRLVDTNVGDVDINQDIALGLNARYYFNDYLGIDIDGMYSAAEFPEQRITLAGRGGNQPKSDLEFFTLSLGPSIRYKGEGVWRSLNPYASISLAILFGSASDVNTSPVYGSGGSSSLDGTGFNFRIGTQYNADWFGITVEYRYESTDAEIDHFRSFENGISLTKEASYLLVGGCLFF